MWKIQSSGIKLCDIVSIVGLKGRNNSFYWLQGYSFFLLISRSYHPLLYYLTSAKLKIIMEVSAPQILQKRYLQFSLLIFLCLFMSGANTFLQLFHNINLRYGYITHHPLIYIVTKVIACNEKRDLNSRYFLCALFPIEQNGKVCITHGDITHMKILYLNIYFHA